MRGAAIIVAALGLMLTSGPAAALEAATPVDAPELARPGPFHVGYSNEAFAPSSEATGVTAGLGRPLSVDIWYPAKAASGEVRVVYSGSLTGENGRDVAFTSAGSAVRNASSSPGLFPLVILAHGYGGTPVAMSWLGENLASKGYIVVAPRFEDPPITDPSKFGIPLARRPLDIAFVAGEARRRAKERVGLLTFADPGRAVLIGYSMGGYGVLTNAGARLDPALAEMTSGALANYVSGGRAAKTLLIADLKAVVAISPAGRFGGGSAWGEHGLEGVTTPTLFIVGDADAVVGYDPGVKTLFDREIAAPRYLLTFEHAGHSIGMNPAPAQMRGRLWDQDWFEDPVWRKDRVTAIQLHFITAFLGLYVKGEAADTAYLDVPEPVSNDGVWPARAGEAYDRFSPGSAPITVWKGFQRSHAAGLELRFKAAIPAP